MAKIRCKCCGGVAESVYRHDFVRVGQCKNQTFVDGGDDYLRCGGVDLSLIEVYDPITDEYRDLEWNETD